MMLMDPSLHMKARDMAAQSLDEQLQAHSDLVIRDGLLDVGKALAAERPLEALKKLRALIPIEDKMLGLSPQEFVAAKEVA
ncbi:MAG: flagellar biosynthesis repressor FlbT, partial [Hyphomicrobium sp.]